MTIKYTFARVGDCFDFRCLLSEIKARIVEVGDDHKSVTIEAETERTWKAISVRFKRCKGVSGEVINGHGLSPARFGECEFDGTQDCPRCSDGFHCPDSED